jgi:hypothetical protein
VFTVTAAAEVDKNSANYMMPVCRKFLEGAANRTAAANTSRIDAFDQGICVGIIKAIAFMGTDIKIGLLSFPEDEGRVAGAVRRVVCMDIPDGVTVGQEVSES